MCYNIFFVTVNLDLQFEMCISIIIAYSAQLFIAGMLFYMLIDLSAQKPYSAKSSASAQRCLLNRHNVFLSITFLKFI